MRTGLKALCKPQSLGRQYGIVSSIPVTMPPQFTTPQSSVFDSALAAEVPRNNWTKDEIKEIYDTPLMKLAFAAVSQLETISMAG